MGPMLKQLLGWSQGRIHRLWLLVVQSVAPNEKQKIFVLEVIAGALCGLAAVAFHISIRQLEAWLVNPAIAGLGSHPYFRIVLVPAIGALLAGLLIYFFFPGAAGSGIPKVKEAYLNDYGYVSFKNTIGKFIACTVQLGTGSSMGREGPTVMICAGIVNLISRAAGLTKAVQRRMSAVGVAAGIAAAFNAPIAAVTFTMEEVVGDLDQTMLSGVIVAAAVAAVVERVILGRHPVFHVTRMYELEHLSDLPLYAALGGIAAIFSVLFTDSLLELRKWFNSKSHLPAWFRPAIGGLVTGLLALFALRWLGSGGVTGGGYEQLNQALEGNLPLKVMLALAVIKLAATVFSYSSGGAGGIFAPVLFMGAMLGGFIGNLSPHIMHNTDMQIGAFALVGMGAMFAGVIRAPITSVLIIFEMTGSYGLILPLMIANMIAFGIARHWRPTQVYEALLEQDGIFLPHKGPKPQTGISTQLDG